MANAAKKIVVIGNGMAGVDAVEAILKLRSDFQITVFGDEPYTNYNRILLSDVLAGKTTKEKIILHPKEWYDHHGIDLRLAVKVVAIDPDNKMVTDATGAITPYDHLIIATGALPFVPPIPGREKEGVMVFRTMEETEAIITASRTHKQAVVIGGGLLGLEAARGMINHGICVTVVHLADRLMDQQLDSAAAALLKREIERMGIRVLLNATAEEMLGEGRVTGVRLATGEILTAQVVLITTGIRPHIALAKAAGLAVNRGIMVDDRMESSLPGIFAIGDVAEHRGKTYGLVSPLKDQAGAIASAIAGDGTHQYHGTICETTLKVAGIDLVSAGDFLGGNGSEDLVFVDPEKGVYKKCVIRGNLLTGFVLLGDIREGARLFGLMVRKEEILKHKAHLLGGVSVDEVQDEISGIAALPDADFICTCNSVTKGAIVCAIREKGLKTREAVAKATEATTGCGSCAQWVDDLLAWVKATPQLPVVSVTPLEEKGALLKMLDVEKIKQEGLGLDFYRLKELGTRGLTPDDYYRLKTYGLCGQKHPGYFMLRTRVPGGRLTAQQMEQFAEIAETYGRGRIYITARQALEINWVRVDDALDLFDRVKAMGLANRSACGHTVRNVVACPHGGISEEGVIDVQPWAKLVSDYFVERSDRINPTMPSRLNISFAACQKCASDAAINDIGFVAVSRETAEGKKEIGFEVWLGGSLGPHPILGFKWQDFIPATEALPVCQTILALHTKYGDRTKGRTRLKFLIEAWGREKFIERLEKLFVDKRALPENMGIAPAMGEADPPAWLQRLIAFWMPGRSSLPEGAKRQRQKGYLSVTVAPMLGEIRSEQFRALTKIAKQYANGVVHFTKEQAAEIHWIPSAQLTRVIKKLHAVGLSLQGELGGPKVMTCPGGEFCVLAVTHSRGTARDILKHYKPEDPHKAALLKTISVHISGCSTNCAKHHLGDIGLEGVQEEGGGYSYQLFLGGKVEGGVQLGEVVRTGVTDEMILPAIDAVLEAVLRNRHERESFQEVVSRVTPREIASQIEARLAAFATQHSEGHEMVEMVPDLMEMEVER